MNQQLTSVGVELGCPSVANEDETAVSADKLRQVLEEFGVSIHLAY